MSSRWSWVFGIVTAAGFVLAVIFFIATQQITGRDWVVLAIGLVLGAMSSALVSTFIYHRFQRPQERAERTKSTGAQTEGSMRAHAGRASIGVPGQVRHGKLYTSLNIRTRVHTVYWKSNKLPAGELHPGPGGSFVVFDEEGEHIGSAPTVQDGMDLIEEAFNH